MAGSGPALAPGAVTGDKIAVGTITTDTLAPNAVSQTAWATGTTSSPSTTSPAPTPLPEMSVTLTTVGGTLEITFNGTFEGSTAGSFIAANLFVDGGDYGVGRGFHVPVAGYRVTLTLQRPVSIAPGVHTFAIYWATSGGTAISYSTWRDLVVTELRR